MVRRGGCLKKEYTSMLVVDVPKRSIQVCLWWMSQEGVYKYACGGCPKKEYTSMLVVDVSRRSIQEYTSILVVDSAAGPRVFLRTAAAQQARGELTAELGRLRAELASVDSDLVAFKDNDPEAFKAMCESCGAQARRCGRTGVGARIGVERGNRRRPCVSTPTARS
eukprot:364989-Chlamydomonas_euryale.AAC.8